jgi:hypothetical protein
MAGYLCPMPLASSFWRTLSDVFGIIPLQSCITNAHFDVAELLIVDG